MLFYVVIFGLPLLMIALAVLAAHFYQGGDEELLDWTPTRSPETEARLQNSDVEQMLAAQNRYRRARGAPERTLEDVLGYSAEAPEL